MSGIDVRNLFAESTSLQGRRNTPLFETYARLARERPARGMRGAAGGQRARGRASAHDLSSMHSANGSNWEFGLMTESLTPEIRIWKKVKIEVQ